MMSQFSRLPSYAEIDAVAGRRSGVIRCADFARKLGVHPRTVRRCYERGGLPGAIEHGERLLMIPAHLLRLAEVYGLLQVERMAMAGLLSANPIDLPQRYSKRADRP